MTGWKNVSKMTSHRRSGCLIEQLSPLLLLLLSSLSPAAGREYIPPFIWDFSSAPVFDPDKPHLHPDVLTSHCRMDSSLPDQPGCYYNCTITEGYWSSQWLGRVVKLISTSEIFPDYPSENLSVTLVQPNTSSFDVFLSDGSVAMTVVDFERLRHAVTITEVMAFPHNTTQPLRCRVAVTVENIDEAPMITLPNPEELTSVYYPHLPNWTYVGKAFHVSEAAEVGTVVARFSVTDPEGSNQVNCFSNDSRVTGSKLFKSFRLLPSWIWVLTYSEPALTAQNKFMARQAEGNSSQWEVVLIENLDWETSKYQGRDNNGVEYNFTVFCFGGDDSMDAVLATFPIAVDDVNEYPLECVSFHPEPHKPENVFLDEPGFLAYYECRDNESWPTPHLALSVAGAGHEDTRLYVILNVCEFCYYRGWFLVLLVSRPGALNYERRNYYNLTLSFTDLAGSKNLTDHRPFEVWVEDRQDPPEFSQRQYSFSLLENTPIGSEIYRLLATDEDVNDTVEYSIEVLEVGFHHYDVTGLCVWEVKGKEKGKKKGDGERSFGRNGKRKPQTRNHSLVSSRFCVC